MNNQDSSGEFLKNLFDNLNTNDPHAIAMINDQRLLKIADYEVTNGYRNMKVTPEDVQERFVYYKTRVMNGSFTIKDLEDEIFSKYGIQEGKRNTVETRRDPIGFRIENMRVADIPENSPENH